MNMWRIYFEVCDILACLIPNRQIRNKIRRKELYDYRRKFNALRAALPHGEFKRVRVIKGGWNIGFIVNKKYVCKIRKFYDKHTPVDKIIREKRITDAFAKIVPLKIPQIEIIESRGFTFYKYNFIPGTNLNRISYRKMVKYGWEIGHQIAQFIDAMHNSDPVEIADLKSGDGDGWNHNDICNNVIIDKKTMRVVGLIDWEYAGWGTLETEFHNCTAFSKKMYNAGLGVSTQIDYITMQHQKKRGEEPRGMLN